MSARQSIISALVTRLQTIKTSAGYSSDLGSGVEEWKTWDTAPDLKGDTMIVRDTKCDIMEDAEYDDNAGDYHTKRLTVQLIIITSGSSTAADLRAMLDDVYRAIGTDDSLGGLAQSIEPEGDQTDIDRQAKTYGATLITLAITYRVTRWRD